MRNTLLTRTQAARQLGVHRHTLRDWSRKHQGPPTLRVGKRHLYPQEVLDQWVKALSLSS
jgi:excisionase family DNA binding protein